MGYKNREIEIKLQVEGQYSGVVYFIKHFFKSDQQIIGKAADLYWLPPAKNAKVNFVRLRKNSSSSKRGQLTVKATDTKSVLDRLEIDVEIPDYNQAKALMLALHGEPYATVEKKYQVFFLGDTHTNISVYQVTDDDRVFVEIEAKSMAAISSILKEFIANCPFQHKWVNGSVFDLFVKKKSVALKSTKSFFRKTKVS